MQYALALRTYHTSVMPSFSNNTSFLQYLVGLGEAYERDRSTVPTLGISVTKLARWGQQLRDALQATQARLTNLNRAIQPHACPICGVYFDSRKSVKLHMYQSHKSSVPGTSGPDARPADQADVTSSCAIVHADLPASAAALAARAESCHASLDATGSVIPSIMSVVSASSATRRSVSGEVVKMAPVFNQDAGDGLVFDRSVHSRDGLPTCSGCGAKSLSFAGGIVFGSTSIKAGAPFLPDMMQRLLLRLVPYVLLQCARGDTGCD